MRAFAHTFGILAPTADSASGGFVRQIPPLPVTPAAFEQSLQTSQQRAWEVYAKPPFAGAEEVRTYLGRYVNRIAISQGVK